VTSRSLEPGLASKFILASFCFSRMQHDEGDADDDGGGGQQGVPADLLAEQPPPKMTAGVEDDSYSRWRQR
jgi:hypothetical protein